MSFRRITTSMAAACVIIPIAEGLSSAAADDMTQYPFNCAGITPPVKTSGQYGFRPYNNCGKPVNVHANFCGNLEGYDGMKAICPHTDHSYQLQPQQKVDPELAFFGRPVLTSICDADRCYTPGSTREPGGTSTGGQNPGMSAACRAMLDKSMVSHQIADYDKFDESCKEASEGLLKEAHRKIPERKYGATSQKYLDEIMNGTNDAVIGAIAQGRTEQAEYDPAEVASFLLAIGGAAQKVYSHPIPVANPVVSPKPQPIPQRPTPPQNNSTITGGGQ